MFLPAAVLFLLTIDGKYVKLIMYAEKLQNGEIYENTGRNR